MTMGQLSGKVSEGDKIKKNFWHILNEVNEGDKKTSKKKF